MRKITTKAISAFNNDFTFSESNTTVTTGHGKHELTGDLKGRVTTLSIFGNTIAVKIDGRTFITNCGYKTNTTKERLNGLDGVSISQANFIWYLNGKEWDGKLIEIKTT